MSPEQLKEFRKNDMLLDPKYDLLTNAFDKHIKEIEEKKKAIENVSRYDFLPIVKINNSEDSKNAIISIKECADWKKEKINLGTEYDDDKREYIVAEIVIALNSTAKIPLVVKRGFDPIGLQDEDGVLKFSCNNGSVNLKFINSYDVDYENNEEKYDLKDSEYGDEFVIEIAPTKLKRGTKFTITVSASDDDDGLGTKSNRVGICGKFNFTVIQNDVFLEEEVNNLLKELKFIKPFAEAKEPSEYAENYCMAAAERGLSKLLNNTSDFYSLDRNHNRLNNISFSGKNASDRGNALKSKGYVIDYFEFNDYKIVQSIKNSTVDRTTYEKNKYLVIELGSQKKLFKHINKTINNRMGYHVFYLSVTNDFHTLLLVIDYRNPCKAEYAFYDEYYGTSSFGNYTNIEEGFRIQTSWTFLNDYMNRGFVPDNYSKTTNKLWKIQRK
jgi:hypothetical protein